MREYNKEFEGKCCENNFGSCDWTCEEIATRINSRASKGTVYSRGEIDTLIGTLRAQVLTALSNNRVIIDSISNLPQATSGNAGFIFVTNDEIPSDTAYNVGDDFALEQVVQQVLVSDGTQWIEIVDRTAFTALNPLRGDMEKSVYDGNDDGIIDISAGGTGSNLANVEGLLSVEGGTITAVKNYNPSNASAGSTSDVILSNTSESVQIFNPGGNIAVIMPPSPTANTSFRLINKSTTASITVRVSIAGATLVVLEDSGINAVDFHYDTASNNWVGIKLELI